MLFLSLTPSNSPHFPSSSEGQLVYSMLDFADMTTETHIKEGIKKSYLLIIGSNSSHPGKKTLNQQKRIKGEIKEGFLAES